WRSRSRRQACCWRNGWDCRTRERSRTACDSSVPDSPFQGLRSRPGGLGGWKRPSWVSFYRMQGRAGATLCRGPAEEVGHGCGKFPRRQIAEDGLQRVELKRAEPAAPVRTDAKVRLLDQVVGNRRGGFLESGRGPKDRRSNHGMNAADQLLQVLRVGRGPAGADQLLQRQGAR